MCGKKQIGGKGGAGRVKGVDWDPEDYKTNHIGHPWNSGIFLPTIILLFRFKSIPYLEGLTVSDEFDIEEKTLLA